MVILVVEERPVRYIAVDGQHWGKEADARRHNAEQAAEKIVGRWALDQLFSGRSFISNITRHATIGDLKVLVMMLNHYETVLAPPIKEITQQIGHLPGGRVRKLLTDDGVGHYSKENALDHLLSGQFIRAYDTGVLSAAARACFAERGMFFDISNQKPVSGLLASFRYLDLFRNVTYADGQRKDMVPIWRDAFSAMIVALETPVPGVTPT